ncbi:hypothetical protein H6F47_11265 [Sphaerospermopsis sp. FACHB-1094]|uniref:hypothetical protein n=1 Tax=Sphaerospermopsis sp. FACHB-1094 TaxID=2692861 RepID=UPI00168278BF|nr:hypothetical protein [Sphaerospermopsis sp. FACHB-1094]MBD2132991.1 hypothetical protein [Sphaerospermopsis sp. FACHB-1094]
MKNKELIFLPLLPQSPVTSHQSPVTSPQSPVPSPQSPVPIYATVLANNTGQVALTRT